jgi:hypothetical protein
MCTICQTRTPLIQPIDDNQLVNEVDDNNERLCNAILETIEKASEELVVETSKEGNKVKPVQHRMEEDPLPSTLRAAQTSTITSNEEYYEDISSDENGNQTDINTAAEFVMKFTQPSASTTTLEPITATHPNMQVNTDAEITISQIDTQPMFTKLIPVQNNDLSNPPSLKTLSIRAQSNAIPMYGANLTHTELTINNMNKQNEIMSNLEEQQTTKTIGGKTYWPYPMTSKSNPNTWYRVQAGGNIIMATTKENQDCNTPVMDERPSPPSSRTPPRSRYYEIINSQTDTKTCSKPIRIPTQDRGTETEIKGSRDMACSPIGPPAIKHPTQDRGTTTAIKQTSDMASSPIMALRIDIGTDPINWGLENTKRILNM